MIDYTNKIIQGDNLKIMKEIPDKFVDLIYLDPPFFSQKNYDMPFKDKKSITIFQDNIKSFTEKKKEEYRNLSEKDKCKYCKKEGFVGFKTTMQESRIKLADNEKNKNDFWENRSGEGLLEYLRYMRDRLVECYRVLKDTGSIYLHCDWHASHYLKILMDEIFGYENFRDEIIWHYGLGGQARGNKYSQKHDILLFYTKGNDYIFNANDVKLSPTSQMLAKYCHIEENGKRYMLSHNKKYYMSSGKACDDVWDIASIAPTAKERLGYPTQKPEALLERIIKASSNEGDIVLDPFCGCGTSITVAAKLKRNIIGIDISPPACEVMKERLWTKGIKIEVIKFELEESDIKEMDWFEFQNWSCDKLNCIPRGKGADKGIDGEGEIKTPDGVIPLIVQCKHWKNSCGEPVVRDFYGVLANKDSKYGVIVANSFSVGARKQVKSYARNNDIEIYLITSKELLDKDFNVDKRLGFDKLGYYVIKPDYAPWRNKSMDIRDFIETGDN